MNYCIGRVEAHAGIALGEGRADAKDVDAEMIGRRMPPSLDVVWEGGVMCAGRALEGRAGEAP